MKNKKLVPVPVFQSLLLLALLLPPACLFNKGRMNMRQYIEEEQRHHLGNPHLAAILVVGDPAGASRGFGDLLPGRQRARTSSLN